jgi:uncharacterized protein
MYFEIVGTQARLLGSMHAWPAEAAGPELPGWIEDAYQWSECLYFEADTTQVAPIARYPAGSNLQQFLPQSVYSDLERALPAEIAFLRGLKPWAALVNLQFLGKQLRGGVEPQLSSRAATDLKPIAYLETVAEFVDCVEGVSPEDYAEAFAYALRNLGQLQRVLTDMQHIWFSGRIDLIERLIPQTLLGLPIVAKILLNDRNLAWLPKILAAIGASQRTLIAVGAAHLPREQGIIALLNRAGLTVRPL